MIKFKNMKITLYAEIQDKTEWIKEREWTSGRFTWGEGYNEYDYEEGEKIEEVNINIFAADSENEVYYSHYADEIKEKLFLYTNCNIPVPMWTHIKYRSKGTPTLVLLNDGTSVEFIYIKSQQELTGLIHQHNICTREVTKYRDKY